MNNRVWLVPTFALGLAFGVAVGYGAKPARRPDPPTEAAATPAPEAVTVSHGAGTPGVEYRTLTAFRRQDSGRVVYFTGTPPEGVDVWQVRVGSVIVHAVED